MTEFANVILVIMDTVSLDTSVSQNETMKIMNNAFSQTEGTNNLPTAFICLLGETAL